MNTNIQFNIGKQASGKTYTMIDEAKRIGAIVVFDALNLGYHARQYNLPKNQVASMRQLLNGKLKNVDKPILVDCYFPSLFKTINKNILAVTISEEICDFMSDKYHKI